MKARKTTSIVAPLAAFVREAHQAQDRILVLDDYLFKTKVGSPQSRIDQILNWLPDTLVAYDVRLLTKEIGAQAFMADIVRQFEARAAEINKASGYRSQNVVIQVRFTLERTFPYVHDRFAIVDNELWHFGATVGGLHNLVNAATRGWDVDRHDAVRFFDAAWDGDRDAGQDRRRASRGRR